MYIKNFNEITKADVAEVGGKGASLGEMTQFGIPVPPGFVVTTQTYKKFFVQEIPIEVKEEILRAFDELGAIRVAVRSSAVAEDSSTSSWAGQLESFLNVTRDGLIEAIRDCWQSIHSEPALAYAQEKSLGGENLSVAVVVQKMIDSDSSGVIFTINPVTKNSQEIMIEAGFGLGEMLVQGMITPDNYLIDKETLEITNKDIQTQDKMLIFKDGENLEAEVPKDKKSQPALTDDEVVELTQLALKIETHYGKPQDIEWALYEGRLYILQSRPITTL